MKYWIQGVKNISEINSQRILVFIEWQEILIGGWQKEVVYWWKCRKHPHLRDQGKELLNTGGTDQLFSNSVEGHQVYSRNFKSGRLTRVISVIWPWWLFNCKGWEDDRRVSRWCVYMCVCLRDRDVRTAYSFPLVNKDKIATYTLF